MELIRPSFEIWEQEYNFPIEDMYKHIARCTRVCYQSEKKDNNETEEEFVKRVILRKEPWSSEANHLSMLEHGTVYLFKRNVYYTNEDDEFYNKYINNCYSKLINSSTRFYRGRPISDICITTNLRVLIDCAPTEFHARRITVSFITNIGVSREFNRHRVNSIAEESTRYCDYTAGRLQNVNKFVPPAWLLDKEHMSYMTNHEFDKLSFYLVNILEKNDDTILNDWSDIDFYLAALTFAEWFYKMLRKKGWKPQQAREVLPLATKTQLIHTAFIDDWKHFFKLRAEGVSGTPHPNASYLAKPLFEEFKRRNYV